MCEAVSPLFYGYNPFYLFLLSPVILSLSKDWLYSLEAQSDKLVQAYLDVMAAPSGFAFEGLSYSQTVDWP